MRDRCRKKEAAILYCKRLSDDNGISRYILFLYYRQHKRNTTEHVGKLALSNGNDPSAVDKPQLLFFSWKMESTDGVVYNLPDDVYAVLCEKDAIGQTIHIYVYDKFPLPWGRLDPCVITAEIDGAVVGSVDAYNLDSVLVRILTFSMGGFALLFAVLLIYINIQELPSVRKRQKMRSQIKRQKAMEKKARSMTQENGK